VICLEYARKADRQFDIRRAFQVANWPESIDRPTNDKGSPLTDQQIKNAVGNIQKTFKYNTAPMWIEGLSRLRWYPR
jgi:hypothetical protein